MYMCVYIYTYIYIYIYTHTYNSCNTSRYGCPNGMYEIHIVQFLALSLPFSPRVEQRQKKGSLHF